MKNTSQQKAKALLVGGLFFMPAAEVLLHFQYDLAAGITLGIGIATVMVGLKKIKRN
jgi:hypothetical protein